MTTGDRHPDAQFNDATGWNVPTRDDADRIRGALIDSTNLVGVMVPIDDLRAVAEWMREPDHVENASLEWVSEWINRRPLKQFLQFL